MIFAGHFEARSPHLGRTSMCYNASKGGKKCNLKYENIMASLFNTETLQGPLESRVTLVKAGNHRCIRYH